MTIAFTESQPIPSTQPKFPKGEGYGAILDDTYVRLAPDGEVPVRFYTRDSLAERVDRAGSVYENVLDIGYAFARGDVSGGEGLDWWPRFTENLGANNPLDTIRYFDSQNMEVRRPLRGEKSRIELVRDFLMWKDDQTYVDMATSDRYLFIVYGSSVERWDDWDAGSEVNTSTASATILGVAASPQGDLMALLTGGTIEYLADGSTTFAALTTPITNATAIWFAKGRFIAELDNGDGTRSLVEFDSAGANPVGPFDSIRGQFFSVIGSGPAIVAACSDGTIRSYVPEQTNATDPTSVNIVRRAITDMPEGEVAYLLGSNADVLLVLTRTSGAVSQNDVRLYQGAVLDGRFDYAVGQLQLERTWLDVKATVDRRSQMPNSRDEIWFAIKEATDSVALWRFDLTTTGLSRHVQKGTTADAVSLVVFDKRLGAVVSDEVWRNVDNYISDGWLITPNITFGVNTAISWLALVATVENMSASGRQVELWYSTNPDAINDEASSSWVLGIRASSPSQVDIEALLTKVESRQLALMLRIYSSENSTRTPRVTNFAVRGIPSHRDWLLELPVNVSDYIEVPGRRVMHIPEYGTAMHQRLLSLTGKNVEAQVFYPPFLFRGIVDNVVEPTEYITARGSVSVRCVVQLRGERTTQTAAPTGNRLLGMGVLGIGVLGIGQE